MQEELEGKPNDESDDQSALVYLLYKNPTRCGQSDALLPGVVGGDRGPVRRRRRRGMRSRTAARGRWRSVLRWQHTEREHLRYAVAQDARVGRSAPSRELRAEGVATAVRDALHGVPTLQRRARTQVHATAVCRGDPTHWRSWTIRCSAPTGSATPHHIVTVSSCRCRSTTLPPHGDCEFMVG
jgi:hypothetical protein